MTKLPTTCPLVELVRARQRAEVALFLDAHPGADPETIGAALVLPAFSVRLRLAEIAGEPRPWVKKAPPACPPAGERWGSLNRLKDRRAKRSSA